MSTGRGISRRAYLAAVGTAAAGGYAGCTGAAAESVSVLSAGSLATTFDDYVAPAFEAETGTAVHGEYYGTNAVMRMVEDRTKHPDVIVSADATLLRDRLYGEFTDWDVEFATNSLGLGYHKSTSVGRALDAGRPWYEVAREVDDGEVAISDPDLDPLGYRALQAFELAEREHGLDGFREEMSRRVYLEPEEPQLMAGVESGSRAAAVVYRNMAVDHGMPFVEFPDAYNFSDPSLSDHYSTAAYTTEEGYTAEGRPIIYNATTKQGADNPDAGRRLVQFLADNPGLLDEAGLTVTADLPRGHGDLPEDVEG
ncbi:extracellular solute-binding protein [Halobellus rarus]|uniref:Extracellular solute-binding protein n=1 Tax=Halobellus rarus TaxID=1126237 RepID=A0ABD6CN74_9EURY|nr:extracellular solute-binding protein [Halobellus rarus]